MKQYLFLNFNVLASAELFPEASRTMLLRRILEETPDCHLVITSADRWTPGWMRIPEATLTALGIGLDRIHLTPETNSGNREEEIRLFAERYDIAPGDAAIIDFDRYISPMMETIALVCPTSPTGLTPKTAALVLTYFAQTPDHQLTA